MGQSTDSGWLKLTCSCIWWQAAWPFKAAMILRCDSSQVTLTFCIICSNSWLIVSVTLCGTENCPLTTWGWQQACLISTSVFRIFRGEWNRGVCVMICVWMAIIHIMRKYYCTSAIDHRLRESNRNVLSVNRLMIRSNADRHDEYCWR